jgi:carbon-monoxide dehydrogenase large subunit
MTTTVPSGGGLFGTSIKRREDPRFITGRALFTDDVKLPGVTYAAFVRSPYAHARVRGVDTTTARAHPGVRAVFTGRDLVNAGVNPLPVGWLLPDLKIGQRRAMAADVVRHVGEAVAVVIGDTPFAAKDGAELVKVDYEELNAQVDPEKTIGCDVTVHDCAPDNVSFHWTLGDAAATDSAFAGAHTVVRQRLINQRLIPTAIEPRSALAAYNAPTDELTLYLTSQNPHVHRLLMAAFVLGIPEHKFRVIAPDVGGGFGSKILV